MWFASTKTRPPRLTVQAITPGWRAGVMGALLGDALGVPHEFKPGADVPRLDQLVLQMPASYNKTYSSVPYGTWSDDGSQLLCLLATLQAGEGSFNPTDFAERLLAWRHEAYLQAGGEVFDCGMQTATALVRLRMNPTAPLSAGGTDERSNGNGSLMRTLPAIACALHWGGSDEFAGQVARAQSRLTHGHALSQAACYLYTQLALGVSRAGAPANWRSHSLALIAQLASQTGDVDLRAGFDRLQRFGEQELPTGSGFVVDAFWSAIWALDQGKAYLPAVRQAISLGNDTDTTACIAGGLAALAYGLADVPAAWWPLLQVPKEAEALLRSLEILQP